MSWQSEAEQTECEKQDAGVVGHGVPWDCETAGMNTVEWQEPDGDCQSGYIAQGYDRLSLRTADVADFIESSLSVTAIASGKEF